ncbi:MULTISPECIES: FixH family protein [Agrobacterium]|uniref:FixH family protein n=1 Tax=Agrobacterium tumefaciens TaxID=358 RepID=UPI001D530630|nr:FixH family protein [Agrobacterium tumefaciens]NSZ09319.1 FixH family protein [Agrobacterium tumefaciens]
MRATAAALAFLAVSAGTGLAGAGDYEFQLIASEVKHGPQAEVAVRLVDKQSGNPVPGAVIFTTRMDMAPDGMEMMTTSVQNLPVNEAGVYRFRTNLSMAGGWRFKVAAKVQGKPETVQGEVVIKALP